MRRLFVEESLVGSEIPVARPFVKWAGGKSGLLPVLHRFVPASFNTYFEPFVGGGAMFFSLRPKRALISDANEELINCYRVVRDSPYELMDKLAPLSVSEAEYYRQRAIQPETLNKVDRAARFVYLNKTCFNGLYRVNRQNQFNTPFGKYKSVSLVDEGNLLAASVALRGAKIECESYEVSLMKKAKPGDFVYFDPPYVPVSTYSDFKRYTSSQFRNDDQLRLAEVFRELHKRGCWLLLSNSYHPLVSKLYRGFKKITVNASRSISCRSESRGTIRELLVTNVVP